MADVDELNRLRDNDNVTQVSDAAAETDDTEDKVEEEDAAETTERTAKRRTRDEAFCWIT